MTFSHWHCSSTRPSSRTRCPTNLDIPVLAEPIGIPVDRRGSRVVFHGVAAGSAGSVLSRTSDIHPFLITYGWMLPVVFLAGVVAFVRAERLRKPLSIVILCSGLLLVGSFEWVAKPHAALGWPKATCIPTG